MVLSPSSQQALGRDLGFQSVSGKQGLLESPSGHFPVIKFKAQEPEKPFMSLSSREHENSVTKVLLLSRAARVCAQASLKPYFNLGQFSSQVVLVGEMCSGDTGLSACSSQKRNEVAGNQGEWCLLIGESLVKQKCFRKVYGHHKISLWCRILYQLEVMSSCAKSWSQKQNIRILI